MSAAERQIVIASPRVTTATHIAFQMSVEDGTVDVVLQGAGERWTAELSLGGERARFDAPSLEELRALVTTAAVALCTSVRLRSSRSF